MIVTTCTHLHSCYTINRFIIQRSCHFCFVHALPLNQLPNSPLFWFVVLFNKKVQSLLAKSAENMLLAINKHKWIIMLWHIYIWRKKRNTTKENFFNNSCGSNYATIRLYLSWCVVFKLVCWASLENNIYHQGWPSELYIKIGISM